MRYKPLVSVIVNCFNGEQYLHKALSSILSQTYKNWEIIFWDNQSSDNSKKIFSEFKDKRFKYYFSKEHTSLYKARNEAIKISNGDIIAFLDTDDWWDKNKLELQLFETEEQREKGVKNLEDGIRKNSLACLPSTDSASS